MKPLSPIPVIDLDGGDPDLADLLQMIQNRRWEVSRMSRTLSTRPSPKKKRRKRPLSQKQEKALKEKEALYEKHLSNANDTFEGLSKTREDLVKKFTEIQAQIQDVDAKITKLKKPFEKIQEKKT
ncbi:hypothetical protein PIB30_099712, partial [Stylosanthes scabra]|nr:hypothetical protein [Stylosanthes scabra]